MKNKYVLILFIVLLASCSITKRKYVSGYSVNWNHKAPKTIMHKEPGRTKNVISHNPIEPIALKEVHLAQLQGLANNGILPAHLKPIHFIHPENRPSNHISSTPQEEPALSPDVLKTDIPAYVSGDDKYFRKICDQSRTSLFTGILSLTVTLLSLTLGLSLIVLKSSSVGFWATSDLAGPVMVVGSLSGGVLGVLAVVFGIIALHKINNEEQRFAGRDNAVTGIIFASILFGLLTLVLI